MNQEQREELQVKLRQLKVASSKMRKNNFTRKTKGTHYPISVGYSKAVKRPVRDLLNWMTGVEEMLEAIINEEAG